MSHVGHWTQLMSNYHLQVVLRMLIQSLLVTMWCISWHWICESLLNFLIDVLSFLTKRIQVKKNVVGV